MNDDLIFDHTFLQALDESGTVRYIVLSEKGNIVHISDNLANLLGFKSLELAGQQISWIIRSWEIPVIEKLKVFKSILKKTGDEIESIITVQKLFKKGTSDVYFLLFFELNVADENEFSFLSRENEKLQQQLKEYAHLNKKLSDSKKKNDVLIKQLEDKQAYLNSILKSVPASITLISENIILYTNNYTFMMTGYDQEELLGHPINLLFDLSNQQYTQFFTSNNPGVPKSMTTSWKLKEGSYIDVYVTATSLDSDIIKNAYTISAVDISAQRLYEEELIKAKEQAEQAERLKMVFLSNMSHELRTPMNGIIGFAEMLRNTENVTKRDEYLKVIINSSKQLMRIITDLMEISKIETGQVETFYTQVDLLALFSDLYESRQQSLQNRNKESIEIIFSKPEKPVAKLIYTDEVKIRYIMNCLLMNAIKFTDNGYIKFGYYLENEMLHLFVKDTGIGIHEEEMEVIFESFRQSDSPLRKKFGGNGLGLAIAKGFTQFLGGKIWVESTLGEGSTFFVQIPYKPIENTVVSTKEIQSKQTWSKFHLLVVEDDITCFTLIEELLEETGIRITHATTGLEAVRACRKEPDIDIALMDMRLPEMDGYEATKRIKEFKPSLPIIAQTAHALSEDRKKCINAGCNDYITKPLEQEKLLNLLERYLQK